MIETIIDTWGLPAVFLGAALEGDTVAMVGGALAHRGHWSFATAAGVASAGAFAADEAWYFLARTGRDRRIVQQLTSNPSAGRLLSLIGRNPALASFAFRFIWGMRTIGPVAIGAAGVRPALFVPLNLLAVIIWGTLMAAIGWGAGRVISEMTGHLPLHRHLLAVILAAAAIAMLIGWLGRRWWRQRQA